MTNQFKKNKIKILITGFHPYDENMYPHLKIFIDLLNEKTDTQYFYFKERGYGFENIKWFELKKIQKILKTINKDTKKFKKLIKKQNFDKVIIIDHFAFAHLGRYIAPEKLIFWSHDIISYDKKYHNNFIIKKVLEKNKELLKNGAKLIIQDKERKTLLEKSINYNVSDDKTFLMPIFLKNAKLKISHKIQNSKPVLMQCGGCGEYRYTDKLINEYQNNNNWELYLHGFIFPEIKSKINSLKKIPIISQMRVSGENIEKIVTKCDIGFIGYGGDNKNSETDLNFQFIKFATGQTVEFLKLAKPIITIGDKHNLGEFCKEENIGIAIKSIDEISGAIDKTVKNYEFYSKNALNCFNKYFNSDLYINKLLEWL